MAINISLYQITDDERVVGKSIGTAVSTHTITLKGGCSIDNPVVSFSAMASAIAPLNYAYIDTFQRYYFIRDRKSLVNGVVELTLESDPWESFKTELGNCSATIARNENASNGYLLDDAYQLLAYNYIKTFEFPTGLVDESMILMTVG